MGEEAVLGAGTALVIMAVIIVCLIWCWLDGMSKEGDGAGLH